MQNSELDNWRHKGLRRQLIEEIQAKGIYDQRVLSAMGSIPRHLFMDDAFVEIAYSDQAFPIGAGQTISQPFTVAFQTQLLELVSDDKVLEIGTGSGYQACVLAEITPHVFSIERQSDLFKKTKPFIRNLGYKTVKCIYGDGFAGLPAYAPFDKIIITCGAPEIPKKLVTQLMEGGQMVIPLGQGNVQKMLRVTKTHADQYEVEEFQDFKFVPMLKGKV